MLYYLFILGEIYENFFYSLLTVLFVSSQSLVAAGYIATYSLNVSNPGAYVEAMDDLMESDWGKSFSLLLIYTNMFLMVMMTLLVVVLNYEELKVLEKVQNHFLRQYFKVPSKNI